MNKKLILLLASFFVLILAWAAFAQWVGTQPASGIAAKDLDDLIRTNNTALEAAIDQDHDFTTGSTQTGTHDQITFTAPISTPTNAADVGFIYIKDSAGSKVELHFLDEDGDEIQITSDGYLLGTAILDDSVDEDTIEIGNDGYLEATDNAGTGTVDLIKANTSDEIELGANTTVNGTLTTTGAIAVGSNKISGIASGTSTGEALHVGQLGGTTIELSSGNAEIVAGTVGATQMAAGAAIRPSSGTDTSPYGDSVLDGGSNPMAVNTWTDLDLDTQASIGTQKTLVVLKIINNTAGARALKFRPNGTTEEVGDESTWANSSGIGTLYLTPDECGFVMIMTDSSGIVEHKCKTPGGDIDVFLVAYIK